MYRSAFAGCSMAAFLALRAPNADASDSDAQIAQSLFDEARVLLDAGRYAEACPKLAESQRLDPGGGTLLNLALCHEQEGKTATAWLEFREALAQAERDRRSDRADFARTHVGELEPRLVRISVVVSAEIAQRDIEVKLDTSRVPRQAWGTALPVDPGEHRVAATLGSAAWTTTILANVPGRIHEVTVEEPALPTIPAAPLARITRSRSPGFWIALSSAGALAVTSTITGALALGANNYVKDHCSVARNYCWASDAGDAKDRARTFAWISTATLGGAIAAAAVAFVLPLETRSAVSAGFITDGQRAIGVVRLTGF